jgi:hypothetical protein
MHSWLKRTQLVQRPSSEASKPEHRIWYSLSNPSPRLMPWEDSPCVCDSIDRRLLSFVLEPVVGSSCVAEVVPCSPEDADTCCEEQAAGTGPVVEVVKSAYRMVVGDIGNQRKVTGPTQGDMNQSLCHR